MTPVKNFTPSVPRVKSVKDKEDGEDPLITTSPSPEKTSPFKEDLVSLHAILHGNRGGVPSNLHRATFAGRPRIISGELRLPQTTYRCSMYRRRVSPWIIT